MSADRRGRAPWLAWSLPLLLATFSLLASEARAQSPLAGGLPGKWVEVNGTYQRVSNDFGDWQGASARVVTPYARDTWWIDALALRAFREEGAQGGITHRHDWSSRFFHMLGGSVGSGAPILPRYRVDGAIGTRLGTARTVQLLGGASYVKSATELSDVAAIGSIAWYAPRGFMMETGVRLNSSRPGNVQSHRLNGTVTWTHAARRSITARAIAGSEGWQVVRTGTTLTRFHSQEYTLAWREKVAGPIAVSVQGDFYHNPFYTRSGVTFGVARYW